MSTRTFLFLTAITALTIATAASAKTYEVGTCIPNLPHFATIQAAVTAAPPSSTVLVCPGVYFEQVTISKPLTLRGQGINNQDRAVISGGGGSVNATSLQGVQFLTVVLVQNVSPPGDVDIINMTVETNGNLSCGFDTPAGPQANLAGIFYDSGTSGHILASTIRNIQNSGCGYGIWAQNGSAVNQSVEVANDSIHDFDNTGVAAYSNQNPPSLSVKIITSALHAGFGGTNQMGAPVTVTGIDAANVTGTIDRNVITGTDIGIYDHDFFEQTPGVSIGNNDIANVNPQGGIGIALREGSSAKSNQVSNAYYGLSLHGGASANPGPVLFANTIKNTVVAVEYNCTANVSWKSNTINDSQIGYDFVPQTFIIGGGVNPLYNVDAIQSGFCP